MINENTVLKVYSEIEKRELFGYIKKINIQGKDNYVLMECATNVLIMGSNKKSLIGDNLKDFIKTIEQNIEILDIINLGDCITKEVEYE